MVITIKEDGTRFGARVGAIIYNKDKTKILLEYQSNNYICFQVEELIFMRTVKMR